MLQVIYLIFNEGYTASAGERLVRVELCAEALRLGRLLAELLPDEPEALGLLALMLLIEARRPARTTADGMLIRLANQDRSRWERSLIREGQALVRRCLRRNSPASLVRTRRRSSSPTRSLSCPATAGQCSPRAPSLTASPWRCLYG